MSPKITGKLYASAELLCLRFVCSLEIHTENDGRLLMTVSGECTLATLSLYRHPFLCDNTFFPNVHPVIHVSLHYMMCSVDNLVRSCRFLEIFFLYFSDVFSALSRTGSASC